LAFSQPALGPGPRIDYKVAVLCGNPLIKTSSTRLSVSPQCQRYKETNKRDTL